MDEAGDRDPSVPIELTIHFPQSPASNPTSNWQTLTVTLTW
jgi:hypothetical protein